VLDVRASKAGHRRMILNTVPTTDGLHTCPGCGLELLGSGELFDTRSTSSSECRAVYAEVAGFELAHIALLGRWHQLLVDTYAAQHVGDASPRIGPAFALIGLHLALDRGWDGPAVRDAHQALARRHRDWPSFMPAPSFAGGLTIADLALAGSPEAHVEILRAWAGDVWAAWRVRHEAVRTLVAARLEDETHVQAAVGSRARTR
jgi:hypothetical protein